MKKLGSSPEMGSSRFFFPELPPKRGFRYIPPRMSMKPMKPFPSCQKKIQWLHLGQVKRLIRFFKQNRIHRAVMLGGVRKTKLFTDVKPDMKAIAIIAGMRNTHDDAIMRAFADSLEKEGIKIEPSTFLLPELLATKGIWSKRKPSRSEKKDIALGFSIAREIGRLDIGQSVVVSGGSILAVEAIDGTDATIERGGRLGDGEAVLVKICKPNQDFRFDVPSVGVNTIETMNRSDVRTLAIEAQKTLVFDREEMVAKADEYNISIVCEKALDNPLNAEFL
jgi:DUF1009 family protein